MKIENWKKAIDAWTRVKEQAEIDIEQADLYISAIKIKTKEINKNGK